MKRYIIQKRIQLPPQFLDANLKDHLLRLLQEKYYGCCLKNYGHILEVTQIQSFKNIENTVFQVKFEADCLNPKVGDKVEAVVSCLYPQGILIVVKDIQKAFIPISNLKGYSYEGHLNRYLSMDRKIEVDDTITVEISCIRFEKSKESWLCRLVD